MIRTTAILLVLQLLMNSAFSQVNLSNGLIAYYPFNNSASDVSGNGHHGVLQNGVSFVADRNGIPNSAVYFDGINDFVEVANNGALSPRSGFSFVIQFKPDDITAVQTLLARRKMSDQTHAQFQAFINWSVHPGFGYGHNYSNNASCPGITVSYDLYVNTGTGTVLQNQWHCIVGTFDGTTQKIYLNGTLMESTTSPSSLIDSCENVPMTMAKYTNSDPQFYKGVLDEVRIYNRALNQAEVSSLTCEITNNVINEYTPVLSYDPCTNSVTVEDGTKYNTNDTVLLIQMKGAVIDSTNTASFGTITDYKNSGNYEYNYVKSRTGNVIQLKNALHKQYDIPNGKVQLIRVPYFVNYASQGSLTCLPWDGSKGGVLAITVQDSLTLYHPVDVSGKGFRGGKALNSQLDDWVGTCGTQSYFTANTSTASQEKGEGITEISLSKISGRGALANGGGGGNFTNSGGGGGGNSSAGGKGGDQYENCSSGPYNVGGFGGKPLSYSNTLNKIFMGGGGGAGDANDPKGALAFNPDGGNGGGIIIIKAGYLRSNLNAIISNGADGKTCTLNCEEGAGGGGAGGTILVDVNNILSPTTSIVSKGGKGANNSPYLQFNHGPGGGGSGGLLWLKHPSLPGSILPDLSGGPNGISQNAPPVAWGATQGSAGVTMFNLQLPMSTSLFKPNIDSVRVRDTLVTCNSFNFGGLGYTNSVPINTWQWYFGDGGTATTQNTSHTYLSAGTFPVKLVVTDINGCKDSIIRNVTSSFLVMDAGPADTVCAPNSVLLQGSHTGGNNISWSPAAFLDDPTIANPTATPPVTTKFYMTVTNSSGCTIVDSVTIEVRAASLFSINAPDAVCVNGSIQLNASGGDIYSWSPASTLNDPAISNPMASPLTNTIYTVQITDTVCDNSTSLSTIISVRPPPTITISRSNDIDCSIGTSQLNASGGNSYSWTPSSSLNNASISNPVASPGVTTKYVVNVTDVFGCTNKDSVTVKVDPQSKGLYQMPTAFTPNNDGKNDCYGIKQWGIIEKLEFSIYNRWGERVFHTNNPNACWDGKFRGLLQDTGVFVFMINANTSCQPNIFRKGTFVLIR